MLLAMSSALGSSDLASLNEALLTLVAEEAGLRTPTDQLRTSTAAAIEMIGSLVPELLTYVLTCLLTYLLTYVLTD